MSKANTAIQELVYGKINSTINQLGAFMNDASAQRGKKITKAAADDSIM
ncbi:hypothetical protein [Candidatus Villigracilis affinis]|nr:hypothetical protein [Anaerolineales bacterium]